MRPPASRSRRRSAQTYTLAATSRKLIELYEKSVIPGAQLALESSMAGYQTGTLDFLSLFSNFMNVVEYELMYHEEVMQLPRGAGTPGRNDGDAVMKKLSGGDFHGRGLGGRVWLRPVVRQAGGRTRRSRCTGWIRCIPGTRARSPGIAPDCNMKLVPVYPGEEARYERRANKLPEGSVQISPEKQQLIGVEYGTAEYETVKSSVRAVARVTLDETKIAKVHSKLEGWIDQVFVDFTGKQVKQGDPLLTIYSPEALATQQEYLLAIKAQHMMHDESGARDAGRAPKTWWPRPRSAWSLWDIGEQQIAEIAAHRACR